MIDVVVVRFILMSPAVLNKLRSFMTNMLRVCFGSLFWLPMYCISCVLYLCTRCVLEVVLVCNKTVHHPALGKYHTSTLENAIDSVNYMHNQSPQQIKFLDNIGYTGGPSAPQDPTVCNSNFQLTPNSPIQLNRSLQESINRTNQCYGADHPLSSTDRPPFCGIQNITWRTALCPNADCPPVKMFGHRNCLSIFSDVRTASNNIMKCEAAYRRFKRRHLMQRLQHGYSRLQHGGNTYRQFIRRKVLLPYDPAVS